MRTAAHIIVLATIATGVAFADPVVLGTIYDPFPGSSCPSGCDVIGENSAFDIQKIQLLQGPGTFTVKIFTNYDHTTEPPNPWSYTSPGALPSTLHLNIGDLFFTFGGTLTYGIALPAGGHNGFREDGLYRIGGAVGTQTASQVLGIHSYPSSSWIFRDNESVWLGGSDPAGPLAQGTHQVDVGGNGSTQAKWIISVTFPSSQLTALWSDIAAHDGEVGVYFASNTCGNDIVSGTTVVPEPGTGVLVLVGGLLGWGCQRLARARRKA